MTGKISEDGPCEFCGAWSPRSCDLEEETGGECLWLNALENQRGALSAAIDDRVETSRASRNRKQKDA